MSSITLGYTGIAFFNRGCCNGLGQLVSYYLKFKPFRTAQKAILASNTKERNFKGESDRQY